MSSLARRNKILGGLGWCGGICLAFCGSPEAYRALSAENYEISIPFVVLWMVGEICTIIPVVIDVRKWYLIFNYAANIVFISIILGRALEFYGRVI